MNHQSAEIPADGNRLSKEYINSLPIVRFSGDLVLVAEDSQVKNAVADLRNCEAIGFDTESRPAFKKGESYPISLIQMATHRRAYIFKLERITSLDQIVTLFKNSRPLKIGIGIENDLKKLNDLVPFKPAGFVDLASMAKKRGIIQTGARALTARYLQQRLSKIARRTNWARQQLTAKQLTYAATDAWICLKIHPLLSSDRTDYSKPESPATT